ARRRAAPPAPAPGRASARPCWWAPRSGPSVPGLSAVPRVPGIDLDPGVHALLVAGAVRPAHIVRAEAVDALEVGILGDLDAAAAQRDLLLPAVPAENGQRHARVLTQVLEPLARRGHVHEHAA